MKTVTVIIPCYNEEAGIAGVISGFPREQLKAHGYKLKVLVVDNNSTDKTAKVARAAGAKVIHEPRKGKGNAIRTGFYAISKSTDYVVMLDGDDTYRPQEIIRLLEPLSSGFCNVVIGSRLGGRISDGSMTSFNRLGNWVFSHLVRYSYRVNVTDVLTGYFAWTRQAVEHMRPHLKSDGFAIEMEMITKMARLNEDIYSVPISYDSRAGESNLRPLYDGARILRMYLKNLHWKPSAERKVYSPIPAAPLPSPEHKSRRYEPVFFEKTAQSNQLDPDRKKVAVFVSYLPPHMGGIEVVADNQIKALASAGYDVTAVTSACGTTLGTEQGNGYKVHRLRAWNYFETKMGAVFPIFTPTLFFRSYQVVKNADIIHAHDAFYLTTLAAAFWAYILRKPLVLTQHVSIVPHPKKIVTTIQRLVYHTTGKFIMRTSAAVLVLNARVHDFVVHQGVTPSKVIFVPNGVDTHSFTPAKPKQKAALRQQYGLPADATLALFVGRFVPKKGFDKLIALPPVPSLHMVFAGGNAPSAYVRPDHHFLGPISRQDIANIYKMCDIFILPSSGEGFPVTAQEAMASGLPIVMTDDPAYSTYKLDKRLVTLVPAGQESLARALATITADSALHHEMADYSRRLAKAAFSMDANTRALIRVYEEAMDNNDHSAFTEGKRVQQ